MEDDEELCPVCESTCTCNHQPKDRGSARANGYRPKATYSGGKGNHHFPRRISPPPSPSNNDETSISGAPDSPTSGQPLRIRLKLAAPRPSTPPSSTRRKRSITYTSSSDSSSSSALNNKSRLPLAQTSAVSSLASHRVPPVNSSSHQGRPSNIQIQTSRSATPLASTSRAPSMSAGPSTLQTPTPKSRQPSSAWFLGVAPPGKSSASTSQLKGASRKPAGPGKALSQSYSRSNNVASRSSGGKGGHKIIGPSSKSTAASGTKVLSAGKSKAAMTKPPKAPINKSRGPTAPRKSSSPKKRRKIDYTPSPSPPLHGASSMDETSEDEYREYATVSRPKAHRPFAGPSRGRGGYVPTGLGRPVGVASLPTFMPKPFSSASESSDDDLDDAKAVDVADIDDLDDDDDDDDIMKEEERMILKEERKKDKNKRKKKETGGGNHRQHQAKKETVKADNDIFMNSDLTSLSSSDSSSSSSSSASDSDSVASSGDEEDDEADAEADEDDDMADLGDEAAMWSDSTDEGDAALFFANFLSSDEHDDEEEEGKDKSSSNEMTEPQPLYASLLKGANNILDFEHGQHRRSRRRRKHSADVEDEQNFIVTEDHDGRLVFAADGWEGAEWAKADGLVLDDDEEVTSEESEIGGDPVLMEAANAEDDEESGVTTTESDFDGNTTFDEGLDEDGLPPSMAYLSQQHQEEQEYNLRRLRQEQALDIPLPLPDHLRTGVELFQGGYATVMFGKFDFPAAAPSVMTSSGHLMPPEFAEVWEGIKDVESINEEETDEEEGMEMTSPVVQVKMEAQEGEAFVLETALSDAIGMGLELGMPSASDDQVPQVPQVPSPVDEIHSLPQEDHPPTPPRKMPVMGSFRRSPPSLEKAFVESSHPPAVIAPEHSLLVSPIVEKPPVNIFSAQPSVNNAGEPPASGDSTTSATLPPKRMAIIDGKSTVPIPSPFAAVKKRRKSKIGSTEESDGSMSVGQRSDFFFSSHTGFGSWELGHGTKPRPSRSARSSFSQPFPPPLFPPLNLSGLDAIRTPLPGPFTPGAMPPPPPPLSAPIELADVLDSSFLNQGAVGDATCTTEDEDSSTLTRNLERWARVPMGTFRHSRAFGSIGNEAELAQLHGQPPETPRPVSDGFSYGATPTGPPIKSDSALWSDGIEPQLPAGSKGKGRASSKRRAPKLVLSPALLPIKDEEVPAEPDEMDVDLIPGIAEEEGYFSRKQYKGGREGTGRERLKRKFEEKERKSLGHGTGPKTPLQNRVKTPSSTPVSPQNDLPAKTN